MGTDTTREDRGLTLQVKGMYSRNVHGFDITSERNIQGTDITSDRKVQGMDITSWISH